MKITKLKPLDSPKINALFYGSFIYKGPSFWQKIKTKISKFKLFMKKKIIPAPLISPDLIPLLPLNPGYIFVPYILEEGKPSKQYEDFMKEYKSLHEVCPNCGSKKYTSTLMGFIFDFSKPEDYKDRNICTCQNCNHKCIRHERISKEEFNKKNINE